MPNLNEHCEKCLNLYGISGEEIHQWMDAPIKLLGPNHRVIRHNFKQKLPIKFIEKYGEDLAYEIMREHLIQDSETFKQIPDQEIEVSQKSHLDIIISRLREVKKRLDVGDADAIPIAEKLLEEVSNVE